MRDKISALLNKVKAVRIAYTWSDDTNEIHMRELDAIQKSIELILEELNGKSTNEEKV